MALRAIREGQSSPKCPGEPNFAELFPLLGDSEKQEAVRKSNPGQHCGLLINSPTACQNCHYNPLQKAEEAELFEASQEHRDALGEAQYLHDLHQLGFSKPFDELSPEEFEVLRLMREHDFLVTARIQGQEVAQVIAKLFAKPEK